LFSGECVQFIPRFQFLNSSVKISADFYKKKSVLAKSSVMLLYAASIGNVLLVPAHVAT